MTRYNFYFLIFNLFTGIKTIILTTVVNLQQIFMLKLTYTLFISLFFLYSCSSKDENQKVIKKKRFEPNTSARMQKEVDKGGGVFNFSGEAQNLLGKNNPMWKATLSVLDFTPLTTASYNGGIIVTDWYSSNNSKESIKISVTFLSEKIASSSIEVKSYKRLCDSTNQCKTSSLSDDFNFKIKNRIINEVKRIELKSNKKK